MSKNDGWTEHSSDFEKWVAGKKGDSIEGRYLGSKELESQDDASKTWTLYRLKTEDGRTLGFSGSNFSDSMAEVQVGHLVRVTYLGEKDLGKPGRSPMKSYKVQSKAA